MKPQSFFRKMRPEAQRWVSRAWTAQAHVNHFRPARPLPTHREAEVVRHPSCGPKIPKAGCSWTHIPRQSQYQVHHPTPRQRRIAVGSPPGMQPLSAKIAQSYPNCWDHQLDGIGLRTKTTCSKVIRMDDPREYKSLTSLFPRSPTQSNSRDPGGHSRRSLVPRLLVFSGSPPSHCHGLSSTWWY